MDASKWISDAPEREKAALKRHQKWVTLYHEDRFAFERQAREMVDAVIDSASDEEMKERLRAIQDDWNRKMKGAGSRHNRFVLARTFFWEHFHDVWQPAIRDCSARLSDLQ